MSTAHKNRELFLFILGGMLFLLAACAPGPSPTVPAQLEIALDETGCTPSQWQATAGEEVQLQVTNSSPHSLQLVIFSDPLYTPFSRSSPPGIYFKADIQPGERRDLRFNAPAAPGEYDLVCGPYPDPAPETLGKLTVAQATLTP
ncbi:MAG: hypothetical protein GYA59_05650 [Chloroflexi bacterium]|nr:hypothetical protein [Chloroflexota bacterium]